MAKKESSGGGVFGPVTKRLPLNYGNLNNEGLRTNKTSTVAEESKADAAACPHPKAKQEEGPAGRVTMGSEMIGVKETHFNRERARASNMGKGRKSY